MEAVFKITPFANSPTPAPPYYPLGKTPEEAQSIISKVRKLETRLVFCIGLANCLEDQIGSSQRLLLAPRLSHPLRKELNPLNAVQILNEMLLTAQVQPPSLHPSELIPKIATFIIHNLAIADLILFKQGSLHAATKPRKNPYITALDIIKSTLCFNMQTAPQKIAASELPFALSGVLITFKNILQEKHLDFISIIQQLSLANFTMPIQKTIEEPALPSPTSTFRQTTKEERPQEIIESHPTTPHPLNLPLVASAEQYISIRKDDDVLYALPKIDDNNGLELLIIFYDALCKIESLEKQNKDAKFIIRPKESQLLLCGTKYNDRNYKLSIRNIFLRLFEREGITFKNPSSRELVLVFNYPEQDLQKFGTTPLRKMLLEFIQIIHDKSVPEPTLLKPLFEKTIKELESG